MGVRVRVCVHLCVGPVHQSLDALLLRLLRSQLGILRVKGGEGRTGSRGGQGTGGTGEGRGEAGGELGEAK
jgi:hypothetical protein